MTLKATSFESLKPATRFSSREGTPTLARSQHTTRLLRVSSRGRGKRVRTFQVRAIIRHDDDDDCDGSDDIPSHTINSPRLDISVGHMPGLRADSGAEQSECRSSTGKHRWI